MKIEGWITAYLSRMSLEEKIGQLFTVICEAGTYLPAMESLITDYHLGGKLGKRRVLVAQQILNAGIR